MASATLHVNEITVRPDGSVYLGFNFTDRNGTVQNSIGTQWGSLEELQEAIDSGLLDQAVLVLQAMGWIKARSPNLTNVAQILGKDLIADYNSPAPIKVQ